MNSDKIEFKAINLDEKENEAIAEKLNVSGQALVIVGDDQKTDLTNDAFMYALGNPEKLKELIIETIDKLL